MASALPLTTGSAEVGFVALSEVAGRSDGSRWIVPANLYNAIRQDAVLLRGGFGNPAAEAFVTFLKRRAIVFRIRTFHHLASFRAV